ncbi:MAG TPA: hypothetical protein VF135_13385, partial [Terriglobales bacterium]
MRKIKTFALVLVASAGMALAQSQSMDSMQHEHGQPAQPQQQPEHAGHDMSQMQGMQHDMTPRSTAEQMELGFGSGTSWQAQSAPEHMWMRKWRDWQLMAHGNLFLTYNQQGGPRGAGKAESANWLMLMEERKLGKGTLQLRQMFSAEPLTAPHPGFPELFQTGETYHGEPLVDHQHPHDVFGEIAAKYVLPLGKGVTWSLYGGPAGEPALGPTAFLHRNSAAEIPEAPLGHHLQDSTHISFGVVTTGITISKVKVEGSVFNG